MSDPVPTLDTLTPAWLTDCLRRAGHEQAEVTGFDWAPIGTGQVANCARLRLQASGPPDLPRHLVFKYPADSPLSRETAVNLGLYRREVRFYTELAPHLPMAVPKCDSATVDAQGAAFAILMEACAGEPGDQLAGCSPAVARAAVMELVPLQARTWCDAALGERFAEPPDSPFQDMRGLYNQMLPGFLDRYRHHLDAEEISFIAATGASPSAPLFQPLGTPFCLEHRDYRLDNFMIDERTTPPRVTILDWQGLRTGRPLNDPALCLGGGLQPGQRRACEESILRDYHAALTAAGIDGFGWDDCWHAYRRATFAGLGLTVVAAMVVEQTERGDAMFTTMAQRYVRQALDVNADEFL